MSSDGKKSCKGKDADGKYPRWSPYWKEFGGMDHKRWKDLWVGKPLWTVVKVIIRATIRRPITIMYPYEKLWYPDNYRGRPALEFNKCVGCGVCAKMCPCNAILIVDAPDDAGEVVRRPRVNIGRCAFCGYCAEYCPTDAMTVSPEYELSEITREDMIYGPRRLAYDQTTEEMKVPLEVTLISDYKAGNGERRVKPHEIDHPVLTDDLCIGCKKCEKVCPTKAITMAEFGKNSKGRPILRPVLENGKCVSCAMCVDECPKDALHIEEVL